MGLYLRLLLLSLAIINQFNCQNAWLFKRNRKPLPVDGGWSEWTSWNPCHLNIENSTDFYFPWKGFNIASRNRDCNSPQPLNGGKECAGSTHKYKQCGVNNALGLENGRITNEQLSASSELIKFNASYGRLRGPSAWCAKDRLSDLPNIYFQVEFKNFVLLSEIVTEGARQGRVKKFKLKYSLSRNPLSWKSWTLYTDRKRRTGEFFANFVPRRQKLNTLLVPTVAKYVRIYPIESFGSVCLKSELYGYEFTCGGLLTTPFGQIMGRSSETVNQDCLWRITVANTTTITLDFQIFDLPCNTGYVEIKDGSSEYAAASVKRRFCGEDAGKPYRFQGNNLWVRFKSNSSSEEIGFNMKYQSSCEKEIYLKTNKKFILTSPGFPDDYLHNTECVWQFKAETGCMVLIDFHDFDIEGSVGCVNDYLLLQPRGMPVLRYCNTNKPNKTMLVSDNIVNISLVSDEAISRKGFKLSILAYNARTPTNATVLSTIKNNISRTVSPKVTVLPPALNVVSSALPGVKVVVSDPMNNSYSGQTRRKKTDDDDDDTWTIVIVGAFSGIVMVLIIIVGGINVHRYINARKAQASSKEGHKVRDALVKKRGHDDQRKSEDVSMGLLRHSVEGSHSPQLHVPFEEIVNEDVTLAVPDTNTESVHEQPVQPDCDNKPQSAVKEDALTEDALKEDALKEDALKEDKPDKAKSSKQETPVHLLLSSGENSSMGDYVDCYDQIDELNEAIKKCLADAEIDILPEEDAIDDCVESCV